MKLTLYILLALAVGALIPIQAGVNSQLRAFLGSPAQAACVSFAVGTLSLVVFLLASRTPLPVNSAGAAWWMWILGGMIGASYVTLIVVLAPVLGAAMAFGLIIGGQMIMALALDHFGWLGFAQHPMNLPRVTGALLVIVGVVVIRKF